MPHAGHCPTREAAGDDEVEVGEVGVNVEGEAVHGDPAADADAHGGDLGGGKGNRETGIGNRRRKGRREGALHACRLPFAACPFGDPHARRPGFAAAFDAAGCQSPDDRFFEQPHVVVEAEVEAVEVEDGVDHELAGAVVGDVAAPVGLFD